MRTTHRVPPNWTPPSAQIDEDYQREIDQTLLRAARRAHREAVSEQKRAERAARKAALAASQEALAEATALLEVTRKLVEQRWLELCALETQMQSGAARGHRVRAVSPNHSKV